MTTDSLPTGGGRTEPVGLIGGTEPTAAGKRYRRGLVMGAGGVLGAAWTIGALRALEEERGIDPRTFETAVGTSVGALLAALLGSGLSTESLVNHQRGIVAPGDPQFDFDFESTTRPGPRFKMGSRELVGQAIRHPGEARWRSTLAALGPQGRGSIAAVGTLVDSVAEPGSWPRRPHAWIVAVDLSTGQRVPFGMPGAPRARLSEAVMASCAVPGWYAPVMIDGRPHVDGGVWSATSLDLLASHHFDEVFCLAPMAVLECDRPRSMIGRFERRIRRQLTRLMLTEAAQVRATGTKVTILAPVADDLRAMAFNMMDSGRRQLVLETSLRTSAATLRSGAELVDVAAAG